MRIGGALVAERCGTLRDGNSGEAVRSHRVYRMVVKNGSQLGQMRITIAPRSSVNVESPSGPGAKSLRHIAHRARSSGAAGACLRQRELLMSATHADNESPDMVVMSSNVARRAHPCLSETDKSIVADPVCT